MTRWLCNCDGDPIAFVQGEHVFTPQDDYVGKLYSDKLVWNGEYIGELFADDRLIFDTRKLRATRIMPGMPALPGFTGEPEYWGPVTMPIGYQDVDLR